MTGKSNNRLTWAALATLATMAQTAWAGPAPGNPRLALVQTAQVLLVLLFLLVAKAATVAFGYCVSEYAPQLFRRGGAILTVSPWKSLLVGAVNFVLGIVVISLLCQAGPLAALGVVLLIALSAGLLSARTLVYQKIGVRLVGDLSDPESPPTARAHFCGGATLELAFLVPFLGQVTMVLVTLTTFGALTLAALGRKRATGE